MKHTNDVSLGAVHTHTHTHTHTQGILINEKVKNRINKIKKDSKSLVLKNDTGWFCYLFVRFKIKDKYINFIKNNKNVEVVIQLLKHLL